MKDGFGKNRLMLAMMALPLGWVVVFMILPYGLIFLYSFWKKKFPGFVPSFQFGNYLTAFSDPQYYTVLVRSVGIASMVTVAALMLSFPFAYFLIFKLRSERLRMALYVAVIAPLWVSYLLRAYTWKTILGSEGIINSFLMWSGLVSEPTGIFLYNRFAMVVTMTYIFIPFMVMPIYASLEKIPMNLVEASADLGLGSIATFFRVILPLAVPGVMAGATFTFCLSLGDFIAPILVGGPDGMMLANLITSQFGAALNWPLGCALSIILLVIVLLVIETSERLTRSHKISLG